MTVSVWEGVSFSAVSGRKQSCMAEAVELVLVVHQLPGGSVVTCLTVLWQMSPEDTRGLLRFLVSNPESIFSLVYSVNCVASVGVAAVVFS